MEADEIADDAPLANGFFSASQNLPSGNPLHQVDVPAGQVTPRNAPAKSLETCEITLSASETASASDSSPQEKKVEQAELARLEAEQIKDEFRNSSPQKG